MALRVGFDATAAARQGAGIGRYTRELLAALQYRRDLQFRVFYAGGGPMNGRLPAMRPGSAVRALPVSDRLLNAAWYRLRLPLPVQAVTGRIDVFHSPDFSLPPTFGSPTVLTVHDLAFLRVPECAYPTLRRYLEVVVPRSVRRADHVIAVSECTRRDVIELLGVPQTKVTAVAEGVGDEFYPDTGPEAEARLRRLDIPRPFLLSAGTLEPRKNYPRLLEALGLLHDRGIDLPLVIAGGHGWLWEPVYTTIRRLGLENRVRILRPDDAELRALYSAAEAFVYPSLYEGFGIPVLEAMACGAPIVCSDRSSMPEVAGDAALLADPYDSEAIAAALEVILGDDARRRELRIAGRERARGFRWDIAADKTAELYGRVAARA